MRTSPSSRTVQSRAIVPGEGSSLPPKTLAGDTLIIGGDHVGT